MAYLTRLLRGESRAHPASAEVVKLFGAGWTTPAGVEVTPETALGNTAVLAAVRVLSESAAMLPLIVYERLERGKQRATGHGLYALLHDAPNAEQTAMEFREISISHMVLWGNFYAEIEMDRAGRVVGLWPLRPDRMRIERRRGELVFFYQVNGGETPLLREQILHIPGLGYDGVRGSSLIGLARNAVGLGLATEEFGSRFFGNGARPGGVLEHPGTLSDTAFARLKDSWAATHQGLENAQRVAILEEGVKYQQIGIPPEDAQFLQTRQFQVTEIARIMRVPPHLLGDLEHATFSNIEHLSLEFIKYSLAPWLVRWEQRVSLNLLTREERRRFFAQHLVEGLLRGDTVTRYQAYGLGRQWGFLSANDVREYENMNPVEGGDVYLSPMNMEAQGEENARAQGRKGARAQGRRDAGTERRGEEEEGMAGVRKRRRLARAYEAALREVAQRLVNRETNDLLNGARRLLGKGDVAGFVDWLGHFYIELRPVAREYLAPSFEVLAELVAEQVGEEMGKEIEPGTLAEQVDGYVQRRVGGWLAGHESGMRAAVERATADGNVEAMAEVEGEIERIRGEEAEAFSREQSRTFVQFAAKLAFAGLGVVAFRWVAAGDSCPYCRGLNGKVVDLEGFFLQPGDVLGAAGELDFQTKHLISHPPLHGGCDCGIAPG